MKLTPNPDSKIDLIKHFIFGRKALFGPENVFGLQGWNHDPRPEASHLSAIFCCYLQHLSNMDEQVHGICKEFEHSNDFVLIFTRANSKYTYSSWEWWRWHARSPQPGDKSEGRGKDLRDKSVILGAPQECLLRRNSIQNTSKIKPNWVIHGLPK